MLHDADVGVTGSVVQQREEVSTRCSASHSGDEFCLESLQLWLHNCQPTCPSI